MAKPKQIELPNGISIPILYEDRVALAIDKPAGWMLAPDSWENTGRNLQLAIISSINAGDFWARSRNLKFLRFVHRLDADTSGIVLFAKSPGALRVLSELFETRRVNKKYMAVVNGIPKAAEWNCVKKIGTDPNVRGRMKIDPRHGKDAETQFRILQTVAKTTLIEASPITGRTHQIRVHLASEGCPVVGDKIYGSSDASEKLLALRAVALNYSDPFQKRAVHITASAHAFLIQFGFASFEPGNYF